MPNRPPWSVSNLCAEPTARNLLAFTASVIPLRPDTSGAPCGGPSASPRSWPRGDLRRGWPESIQSSSRRKAVRAAQDERDQPVALALKR
jgi:hypothetical protein